MDNSLIGYFVAKSSIPSTLTQWDSTILILSLFQPCCTFELEWFCTNERVGILFNWFKLLKLHAHDKTDFHKHQQLSYLCIKSCVQYNLLTTNKQKVQCFYSKFCLNQTPNTTCSCWSNTISSRLWWSWLHGSWI